MGLAGLNLRGKSQLATFWLFQGKNWYIVHIHVHVHVHVCSITALFHVKKSYGIKRCKSKEASF